MSKGYRPYLPDQDLLLPPSLQEWLPEGHLVYFVSEVVDQLDLSAVHAVYGEEKRGQPPYDPRLMIKLLVYGYCTGVFSSRRIQKRLQEDIPFRVLAAGNDPDFRTISDFRKIHIATLQNLFEQVLEMALESGAVKLGRVSVDGTKVKANASKHKAMSYGRMQEKQKQLKESPLPLAMLLVVCCSAFVAALIGFARYAIRAGRAVTVPQGCLEAPPVVQLRVIKVAAEGAIVFLFGAAQSDPPFLSGGINALRAGVR